MKYRVSHCFWKTDVSLLQALLTLGTYSISSRPSYKEQRIYNRLFGLPRDVPRQHGVHARIDRLERLHQVEGDEKTASSTAIGRNGDEHDSTDDIDDGETDHDIDGLLELGTEISDEEVEHDLEDG